MKLCKGQAIPGVIHNNPTIENSLANLSLAIQATQTIANLNSSITPEGVYNSEEVMYEYLENIKVLFDKKGYAEASAEKDRSPEFGRVKEHRREKNSLCGAASVGLEKVATPKSKQTPQKISMAKPITRQPSTEHNFSKVKSKLPGVDVKTKQKVINWLQEISLLKANSVSIDKFPSYCRNGVLLHDLIARLEGRQPNGLGLKNINRNPKTLTSVHISIRRCLEYLQLHERMNPRCLWSVQDIANGNENVIWALLDDIWHFYHGKASPFDPSYSKVISHSSLRGASMKRASLPPACTDKRELALDKADGTPSFKSTSRTPKLSKNSNSYSLIHSRRSLSRDVSPLEKSSHFRSQKVILLKNRKAPVISKEQRHEINMWLSSLNITPLPLNSNQPIKEHNILLSDLYSALTNTPSKSLQANGISAILSKLFGTSLSTARVEKLSKECAWKVLGMLKQLHNRKDISQAKEENSPMIELEHSIINWLRRIGTVRDNIKTLCDINREIRNGTLLCEIAEVLTRKKLHGIFRCPKTDITAMSNIKKALECLRTLPRINCRYLWKYKAVSYTHLTLPTICSV
eukprot:TRINITY_DN4283_c0_g3_i4.p1 TRINITY_DN4283_c0_g3~~TRINITY_DN4283_c0_g3_i4.p1  ORF type:complete len:576 (+),score=56.75 TRINITY_DN4283_c0_g3_i4:321-2048(+)